MGENSLAKVNDQRLMASRLWVGNWPNENATKQDLRNLFSACGKVLDVASFKGYAFVQFDKESDVQKAISEFDKKPYKGNTLSLRPAIRNAEGKRKYRDDDDRHTHNRRRDAQSFHQSFTAPMPYDQPGSFPGPMAVTNILPPVSLMDLDTSGVCRFPVPPPFPALHQPSMDDSLAVANQLNLLMSANGPGAFPFDGGFRPDAFGGPLSAAAPPPPLLPPSTAPPLSGHADLITPTAGFTGPPPTVDALHDQAGTATSKTLPSYAVERPFDAVIIVTQKALKPYAESVERHLLSLNMVVEMIFLLNDKALNKAINDMTCRGVLYCIVVQPQHEEHQSVTINIMHGTPQEHRNMPLNDAVAMLSRNFNAFLANLRGGGECHQPTMGYLLNTLAEGKPLSVADLERIICYLSDRRDRQIEAEGGARRQERSLASGGSSNTLALQQKILSIVSSVLQSNQQQQQQSQEVGRRGSAPNSCAATSANQNAAQSVVSMAQQFGINLTTQVVPAPTDGQSTNQNANFADPAVQKTVDSLLQNPNLFKSLNSASSQQTSSKSSTPDQTQASGRFFGR